jgi:hypothetical protein
MDHSIEVAKHYEIMRDELLRPSVLYQHRIKISKDGDMYCVFIGSNLQEGVAGFGKTLQSAMNDFDTNISR